MGQDTWGKGIETCRDAACQDPSGSRPEGQCRQPEITTVHSRPVPVTASHLCHLPLYNTSPTPPLQSSNNAASSHAQHFPYSRGVRPCRIHEIYIRLRRRYVILE